MSHGDARRSEAVEPLESSLRSLAESSRGVTSGSPQSIEPLSSTSSAANSSTADSTDPPQEDERVRLLRELESSIESFRGGKVSKTAVISDIIRILGEDTYVSIAQQQKEVTFDSYLMEILSIQSDFDHSSGDIGTSGVAQQLSADVGSQKDKEGAKRSRDEADSDYEDDDSGSAQKRKLLESEMPWYIPDHSIPSVSTCPSFQETCRLLRSYNKDISRAKFLVKIAPNCPTGIPSSQWERIFKGDAIDLNGIFASLHHIVPDEERTGRLGETKISFGISEPKKKVCTAAEWSSA